MFEAFNIGASVADFSVLEDVDPTTLDPEVYADNIWPDPDSAPGFKANATAWFQEAGRLARTITSILACALELDDDFFESYTDHSIDVLRMVNYERPEGAEPQPAQLGMGAHMSQMNAEHTLVADVVPLIDLGQWRSGDAEVRRVTADAVDAALRDVGFIIVTNHGIPTDVIGEVRQACAEAFALPVEVKTKYRQRGIGAPGWTPIGAEANSYASGQPSPPDLKENWTVGPVADGALVPTSRGVVPVENQFPSEVPALEPAVRGYLPGKMATPEAVDGCRRIDSIASCVVPKKRQ